MQKNENAKSENLKKYKDFEKDIWEKYKDF